MKRHVLTGADALEVAVRKINTINDPHDDWVSKKWDGNPIEIPVRGAP
jgi:hypothetical protein